MEHRRAVLVLNHDPIRGSVDDLRLIWSSDRTLHVRVGTGDTDAVAERVVRVERAIRAAAPPGVVDLTPGSNTVMVSVDPAADVSVLESMLRQLASDAADATAVRGERPTVRVPVCYGGDHGPDLDWLADRAGMDAATLVEMHTAAEHTVRLVGFSPGFAYLAGLPGPLHAPRLDQPRPRVPPGSVGIAGGRTGLYPHATPGGWRLIGATPLALFDAARSPPALLRAGDRVRFEAISPEEFERIRSDVQSQGETL